MKRQHPDVNASLDIISDLSIESARFDSSGVGGSKPVFFYRCVIPPASSVDIASMKDNPINFILSKLLGQPELYKPTTSSHPKGMKHL